jgi:hypothetical protein
MVRSLGHDRVSPPDDERYDCIGRTLKQVLSCRACRGTRVPEPPGEFSPPKAANEAEAL